MNSTAAAAGRGGPPDAAAPVKIRHHSGDHVFYLYTTAEMGVLCVTDGLPIDEEVCDLYDFVCKRQVTFLSKSRAQQRLTTTTCQNWMGTAA